MIFECPICGHILDCYENLQSYETDEVKDGDLRAWCFGPIAVDFWTGTQYSHWPSQLEVQKKYYSGKRYHEPFEMIVK